jgi:hypothetical protein
MSSREYPLSHMIDQLTGGADKVTNGEAERVLFKLLDEQGAFKKITLADVSREVLAERAAK